MGLNCVGRVASQLKNRGHFPIVKSFLIRAIFCVSLYVYTLLISAAWDSYPPSQVLLWYLNTPTPLSCCVMVSVLIWPGNRPPDSCVTSIETTILKNTAHFQKSSVGRNTTILTLYPCPAWAARGVEVSLIHTFGTSVRRSSRAAFGRSTGNDVSDHYKRNYYIIIFFFSPSSTFLIEGVLESKNLFRESWRERPKT